LTSVTATRPAGHLLIIDALNLIRRIDAVQHKQQAGAQRLQATRSQCRHALQKQLRQFAPSHVLAVFDGRQPSWRQRLYPGYKQDRQPMDADLQHLLDAIQQDWWQLGVDSLIPDQDEADDLIASLAYKTSRHGLLATIVSTDQGFCQLLDTEGIRLFDCFRRSFMDIPWVLSKFGVAPGQLTGLWGLSGLHSSSIPGIRGIGPKGAREIVRLGFRIDQWPDIPPLPEKHLDKLRQEIDMARISTRLVTLRTDLPLGFNLRDIRYTPPDDTSHQRGNPT